MTVGSLFAGIGGFDLGFKRAGFEIKWQVEIDPFCRRVLTHRFSGTQHHEDVQQVGAHNLETVDVIVGGFPCQDLSVAGAREGLAGERSGLFWQMRRIANEMIPKGLRWMVIENVPGLLTSAEGRDFHTVLSALADCGLRRSYRILDSRFFRVAQRRRRVFVVCGARDAGERARTVLFESASSAVRAEAREEAGTGVAATLRGRSARRGVNEPGRGGEDDSNLVAIGVHANQRGELRTSAIAGSLNASKSGKQFEGIAQAFDWQSSGSKARLNIGDKPSALQANQTPAVIVAKPLKCGGNDRHDESHETYIASPLTASAGHHGHSSPRGDGRDNLVAEVANTLLSPNGGQRTDDLNNTFTPTRYGVRRLTPLECERVQGFPDGWTCLCGEGYRGTQFCKCPDTPRYKALGNAVTVTVAHWIAERIKEAEGLSV